jgi:hypothetical protein
LISPVAQAATGGTLMSSSSERGNAPPSKRRFLALGIGAMAIGAAVWSIALRTQPRAETPLASALPPDRAPAAASTVEVTATPAVSVVATGGSAPAPTLGASAVAPVIASSAPPTPRQTPRGPAKPAAPKPKPAAGGDDPFERQY